MRTVVTRNGSDGTGPDRSATSHQLRTGSTSVTDQPESVSASIERVYADNTSLLMFIASVRFRIPAPDAEGIVHDVFLKFARDYTEIRAPRSWLGAAVANASRNYWRDRQREVPMPEHADCWEDPAAGGAIDRIMARLAVASVLRELDDRCCDLLRRFYAEGESTKVIADALDTSAAYIQLRLHTCRKKARAIYEALHVR